MELWKRLLAIYLALGIILSLLPYSSLAADDDAVPTPDEVYNILIAQKNVEGFTEGTIWNDHTHTYKNFKGGPIDGKNIIATGCVAFAFQLSDIAFGNLPARQYTSVSIDQVKIGDILRTNNDTHTVIVLQVSDNGLVLAEGNYSGKVHWGRTMTEAEFKRDVSHYITRYPEGYIPPTDESANELIVNGQFGTGLSWSLTKAGTLTISGTGAMPDFNSCSDQPWYSYNDKIMKIVIEDGITTIGKAAFWMSNSLTIRIPDTVTEIKSNAFRESSLISVTIPGSVKNIGDDAFRACANLALASMMEGVSSIGQRAFQGCTKLVSVDLPASIADLGSGAFYNCTALNFVTFASGNKNTVKMGDNLFMGCWNLFPFTLPEHIDKISTEMFYNCYYMFTGLEIPQGVTTIGESAFNSCRTMSVLIIPDSVTDIERNAFINTALTDIYFKGTEAQWNNIWKSPDLTPILQRVTMHFGELPKDPDPNPKHEHEWGRSEVIQEATETEDGLRIYSCTICDETLREVIPATGIKTDFEWGDVIADVQGSTVIFQLSSMPPKNGVILIAAYNESGTLDAIGQATLVNNSNLTYTVEMRTEIPQSDRLVAFLWDLTTLQPLERTAPLTRS